ncbi:MAG: aromatic ring-hydroxylating oxygenase subunit alpha [Alphaproteobacteria bacterium]
MTHPKTNPAAAETAPSGNAQTIPALWYHDADMYEAEREKIFFGEWLIFCHEALLPEPGSYVAYTVAGRPVMVIRGKDGALRAFHNVCRHRASMVLREGHGKADVLRCIYHGWVYDSEGCLKKAPNFGGDEKALCDRTSLFSIHLRMLGPLVFICMAENAPDFEASLGDLPAALAGTDLSGYKFYDMATHPLACNWKTYIENYMEGYHIPAIHPGLNRDIDFATYRVVPGDRIARHETGLRADRADEAVNNGLWVWVWPNCALNIYKNGMNLELVIPTGPETTELRYCYLFTDVSEKMEEENRRTIDVSIEVTREDIELCEIVQKNLRGGIYDTGELSPRHENGVVAFHDMVRSAHKKARL